MVSIRKTSAPPCSLTRISNSDFRSSNVRAGSPRAISVIGQGAAEVLELQTTIKDAIKVKKMGLPRGAVVGAIVHEESVSIATGDSVVRPGDTLIVFTVVEKLEEVERVLRPGASAPGGPGRRHAAGVVDLFIIGLGPSLLIPVLPSRWRLAASYLP